MANQDIHIPDPIERGEARIEKYMDVWDGESCLGCGKKVGVDNLVTATPDPYSAPVCYDCAGFPDL